MPRPPRLADLLGVPRRGPALPGGLLLGALAGALLAWLSLPVNGAEVRRLLRESLATLRSRLVGRDDRLV